MKKLIQSIITAFALPLAAVLVFTSCDTTSSNGVTELSLSFKTKSQTAAKTTSNSHVALNGAKMLLREIEFKNDIDEDGEAEDSLEFETGPTVVELNLDGSLNTLKVAEVPAGTYNEVEFEVHKPEDNETPPDPDFKTGTSGDQRFSVIINGIFDGQEFTYRSQVNMEQEIEFIDPLVINENEQVNVTLTVDTSGWFVDEAGNQLNPTVEENRSEIDDSIKRSFEGFRDDDKDGEED